MESQKRLILALGLCFVLTVVYSFFFNPGGASHEGADAGVAQAQDRQAAMAADAGTAGTGTQVAAAPSVEGTDGGAVAEAPAAAEVPPARQVEVKRALAHYAFSSVGAGLVGAPLQGKKMREQTRVGFVEGLKLLTGKEKLEAPQMDMARPSSEKSLPLSVGIGGSRPFSTSAHYKVEEGERKLTFVGTENGWEVTKVFTWPESDSFEIRYDLTVKNVGAQEASGELAMHYARAVDPTSEEKPSLFGSVGNQSRATCKLGDDLKHLLPDQEVKGDTKGPIGFFGVDQQYFLAAVFPLGGPLEGRCDLTATPTARGAVASFPIKLAAGQTFTKSFGVYIGPKDLEILRATPSSAELRGGAEGQQQGAAFVPGLDKTVDFGFWAVICNLLLGILKFFHNLTGNWGVAIILLTLLVRTAMVPLAHKSMVSAEAMKKLQPKMEELKKKFADDRERQNMEMMKLYQEAKVNPLGGCLPLLIQMPIWIALFTTLRTSYELYREPFLGPIWFDLTLKDPIYFLPLALGLTQVITMKLQPQMTMDAAQAKMMTYLMPVMFTVFMLNYPCGLTLYIFTSNLFQIVQQYALRKYLQGKQAPAMATVNAGRKK